jgi:transposase
MDNTHIHYGEEILELAERFGEIFFFFFGRYAYTQSLTSHIKVFLPPYSPDLNPIEEAFSKIKAFICHHSDILRASIGAALIYEMKIMMEIIMPSDAEGYFMHAGYF